MEANVSDVNHLDSDVVLPSRKRLHACSNKQNGDNNQGMYMGWDLNRLNSRISYLLKGHLSSENPTEEEIVEASRAVVDDAVKAAMAAKVVAQEKAVIAQKAMAAAKKALELVAGGNKMDQMLKKNKKKHVDVEKLCNSKKPSLDNGKVRMVAKASEQEKVGVVARAVTAAEKALKLVTNGDAVGKAKAMSDPKLCDSKKPRFDNGKVKASEQEKAGAVTAAEKALRLVANGDDVGKAKAMSDQKLCDSKKPRLDNGKVRMAAKASEQEKAGAVTAAEKALRLAANGDDVGKAKAMSEKLCDSTKPRLDNGKFRMAAKASEQEKAGAVTAAEKALGLVANGDDVSKAKAMSDQFSHVRSSS